MNQIWISGKSFSLQNLIERPINFDEFSPFEQRVISFVVDWNMQKTEFRINTSGSTGKPKTIRITRDQIIQSSLMTATALALKNGMTALACLSLEHIAGKMMVARSLVLNLNLIAVNPSSNPLKEIPDSYEIDFAAFVPFQLQQIIDDGDDYKLNKLKTIIVGGAPISSSLEEHLQKLEVPIYQTYGMTETVSHVALRRCNGPNKSEAYSVLDGINISIDSRGCLALRGNITGGKVLQTNDVVNILSANSFQWLGRHDNIINSGGIKLNPETLEKEIGPLLLENGIANRFILAAKPEPDLGEKLILILEGRTEINNEVILSVIKSNLSPYSSPREVYHINDFKTNDLGKINRNAAIAGAFKL